VVLGHWVSFVRPRGAFSEYACVTCGHPFLFAHVRTRQVRLRWIPSRQFAVGRVPLRADAIGADPALCCVHEESRPS
jgi:hypothetical protein